MKKTKKQFPSLDDLAFFGRNKEYGAYYLRKKYSKHLLISLLISVFIFLSLITTPIVMDYFSNPISYDDMMPVIEFYSLNPPSEDDLNALAKSISAPPPPEEKAPVVVDSVPKEETKVEEVKPDPKPEPQKSDSVKGSGGNSEKQGAGLGDDTGIYTTIDVYPRFPGGDPVRFAFLRSQVHYPEIAIKAGIQGVVVVVFVVEKNGSVTNVEVTKGIGGGCDEEAMRVVKMMPLWDPGKRSGKAVRVLVKMPIVFKIPGKGTK